MDTPPSPKASGEDLGEDLSEDASTAIHPVLDPQTLIIQANQSSRTDETDITQTVKMAETDTAQTVKMAETDTAQTVKMAETDTSQTLVKAETDVSQTKKAETDTSQTVMMAETVPSQALMIDGRDNSQITMMAHASEGMVGVGLGPLPANTTCPSCHQHVTTVTALVSTNRTHIIALLLCFVALCCIPYVCDKCKATVHTCPNCHAIIDVYQE